MVQVTQGSFADFTINLTAGGQMACGATATAAVKTSYALSSTGVVTSGTAYSEVVNFAAPGGTTGSCNVTGSGDRTARVSAASSTPVGRYTVQLDDDPANPTVRLTNTNNGNGLKDNTATPLIFEVVAPVVVNRPPVAGNAPRPAEGPEGSTLQTSGSFTDADGDFASITASSGTLIADRTTDDTLSGSWRWELPTTDNVSGSVTVTATDSHGATATQTFTYSATNVAPRVSVQAPDVNRNEGDTLSTGGSFADVSGDTLTITSSAGTLVDNRDGSYTWSLATTNETSGTVTVTATDDDGLSVTDTFAYSAANVAPGVRTDAQNVAGDEGSALGNAGAFSDVPADTIMVRKTGDGTLTPGATNGAWSWSVGGADNAGGLVSVVASDGVADSSPDTFNYTVRNVDPAVAAAATDASGDEGTTLGTSGGFSDVATDPLTITKVSGPGTVRDNGDGTWSWSFDATNDVNADSPEADRVVVVQASDGDGGTKQDSFTVTVNNVAPVVADSAADATGSEGNTLTTQGRFSDVPADTISVSTTSTTGTLVDNREGSWSWSLPTTDQVARGSVTVTARDDNGDTVTDTFEYEAVDVLRSWCERLWTPAARRVRPCPPAVRSGTLPPTRSPWPRSAARAP